MDKLRRADLCSTEAELEIDSEGVDVRFGALLRCEMRADRCEEEGWPPNDSRGRYAEALTGL